MFRNKKCEQCGENYLVFSGEGKKTFLSRKFCSRKCSGIGKNSDNKPAFKSKYILYRKKGVGPVYQHIEVYENNFGKIPKGLVINHKNGNKSDNRIENLEAVTRSENTRFAYGWFKLSDLWWKPCRKCKTSKPVKGNFKIRANGQIKYDCLDCVQ